MRRVGDSPGSEGREAIFLEGRDWIIFIGSRERGSINRNGISGTDIFRACSPSSTSPLPPSPEKSLWTEHFKETLHPQHLSFQVCKYLWCHLQFSLSQHFKYERKKGNLLKSKEGWNITQWIPCEQDPCLAHLSSLHPNYICTASFQWMTIELKPRAKLCLYMIRAEWKRTELGSPLWYIPHGRKAPKTRKKVSCLDTVEHKRPRNIMLQIFFKKVIVHWTIIWNTEWVISESTVVLPYGFQMNTKGSRDSEIIHTFYRVSCIYL